MRGVNKVLLLGNVGKDPEVRTTSSGKKMATVSLATSRTWTDKGGNKQEKTEWHRLVVWNRTDRGGLADVVERYVGKGAKIYVEGSIESREYDDKDGVTRKVWEVNVSELVLLGGEQKAQKADDPEPEESSSNDDLPF